MPRLLNYTLACAEFLCITSAAHAQVHSKIIPVTASDTIHCNTGTAQYPVPNGYSAPNLTSSTGSHSGTVQGGYCKVPVTWNTAFTTASYSINCSPETGSNAGYFFGPVTSQRTATGFLLTISYYLYNYDSASTTSTTDRLYSTSSLGTMNIDCIGIH